MLDRSPSSFSGTVFASIDLLTMVTAPLRKSTAGPGCMHIIIILGACTPNPVQRIPCVQCTYQEAEAKRRIWSWKLDIDLQRLDSRIQEFQSLRRKLPNSDSQHPEWRQFLIRRRRKYIPIKYTTIVTYILLFSTQLGLVSRVTHLLCSLWTCTYSRVHTGKYPTQKRSECRGILCCLHLKKVPQK